MLEPGRREHPGVRALALVAACYRPARSPNTSLFNVLFQDGLTSNRSAAQIGADAGQTSCL